MRISLGLFIFTILFLISCQDTKDIAKSDTYEINGILKGISDSTMIMIATKKEEIDSTMIMGGKFKFTGSVDTPSKVFLVVKNSQDFCQFWLDNSKIEIEAEKGKLRESYISGSQLQKEDNILSERFKIARKEMDSLKSMLSILKEESKRNSILKQMEAKGIEIYHDFVKDYPNSLVSAFTISNVKSRLGHEKTKAFYDMLSLDNRESKFGKEIKNYIDLYKKVAIGKPYVDFQMNDIDGIPRNLSDLDNKVLLLEFWASWCGPCRQENPNLVETYKEYQPKGFEIFAVSLDDNENKWKQAIAEDNLPWIHVSDLKLRNNKAALIYGVSGIPDNFLIDQKGKIIGRNLRGKMLKDELNKVFENRVDL